MNGIATAISVATHVLRMRVFAYLLYNMYAVSYLYRVERTFIIIVVVVSVKSLKWD